VPADIGPSCVHFTGATRHLAFFEPTADAVSNPGMGVCCYGFSDHMYVPAAGVHEIREMDRDTFERMGALPHCDHIYLRVEWRDVQTAPGRLTVPPVWEWTLEAAETHGKPWAFRVMPICPHSLHPRSTPDFLQDTLRFAPYPNRAGEYADPTTKFFPVYDDAYLGAWRELLFLLAERFDAHPLLEFVDISGYGKWGEWHHLPETDYEGERHAPVVRRLVDDHLDAFPETPAVMLLTPSPHRWKDEIILYAIERGCGLRRDSFHPLFTTWGPGRFPNCAGPAHRSSTNPGCIRTRFPPIVTTALASTTRRSTSRCSISARATSASGSTPGTRSTRTPSARTCWGASPLVSATASARRSSGSSARALSSRSG
jgi:hypothetical protein